MNDSSRSAPSSSSQWRALSADVYSRTAASFDRAAAELASGDADAAIALLTECCEVDPANLHYRQTLRQTQKARYRDNLVGSRLAWLRTILLRRRLRSAVRRRDHRRVLTLGETILAWNPWHLRTQQIMGESAEALGLMDVAVFILDQARHKYPRHAGLNRSLARLFERVGKTALAANLWMVICEQSPEDVEAAHRSAEWNSRANERSLRQSFTGDRVSGV